MNNSTNKDSEEMPEWCAIGKWVYDKDTKTIQCINSTSYYLVSIKVELYFINGSSWSGNVAELKTRFVPAEVKIGK